MSKIERNCCAVTCKRFFSPAEISKIVKREENQVLRFAYLAKALYDVHGAKIIHINQLLDFMYKFQDYVNEESGIYVNADEAAAKIGVTKNVLLQMVAGSDAVYQIGEITLINLVEAEGYLQKFKIEIPVAPVPEVEQEKIRGSRFVKEILGAVKY